MPRKNECNIALKYECNWYINIKLIFSVAVDLKYVIRHFKKTLAMYSYIWDLLYYKFNLLLLKCQRIKIYFWMFENDVNVQFIYFRVQTVHNV